MGNYGGKGTETHTAAITGDTGECTALLCLLHAQLLTASACCLAFLAPFLYSVGDPCKDTAGPSLHVLITTTSTTILVLGPLLISK